MTPPSPNPTSIFRWEDSSALEHSCWACPTKSNSPKAIHTCYGIHSIPCIAYHSTMHAVGTSHRCSGCTMNREIHENRHREIAELVAEYKSTGFVLASPPLQRRPLAERSTNMQLRNFTVCKGDVDDERHEQDGDAETVLCHGKVSTATSNENDNDDQQSEVKPTKAEQRQRKKLAKAQKSMQKAAKNEARHAIQVTSDDVRRIGTILHGDVGDEATCQSHPLATDKTIEDVIARNLGFVKQIQCHKTALYQSIKTGRKEEEQRRRDKRRLSEGGCDVEMEIVVDAILKKLGIDTVSSARSMSCTTPSKLDHKKAVDGKGKVMLKLREAIKDDLEKHENDLRQTYIRAGGFFRYAGKAVFERMTEIAKTIDLQTGEEWKQKRKREANVEPIHSDAAMIDNE